MRVGPYEVLGTIGEGATGIVFKGVSSAGQTVALKVLRRMDAVALARFERERRLHGRLGQAEGFVPLVDFGEAPDGRYLVMPFIEGGSLRTRLARPFSIDETIRLGHSLAESVGRAHALGIVHRDLKPENILYTTDGRPLVTDLGLAKHFDREAPGGSQSASMSRSGLLTGTAGYMSPEQMEDSKSVGPPADVFALGTILYECLTGKAPFAGESFLEVLRNTRDRKMEPLGQLRPDTPRWLVDAIERALAAAPEDRFPDGVALARVLAPATPPAASRACWAVLLVLAGVALGISIAVAARGAPPPPPPPPPPAQSGRDPVRAKAAAHDGLQAFMAGDRDHAFAFYDRAVELDPGLATAWGGRGQVRLSRGDAAGALSDCKRATELDPLSAAAWAGLAAARERSKDHDGAIAAANRALELDPGRVLALDARAHALLLKEDFQGAIADATRVIAIDPNEPQPWETRGRARSRLNKLDDAIADLSRAIELDPRNPDAWAQRGMARAAKGDVGHALDDATRAIELDPRVAYAWEFRGVIRLKRSDYEGAMQDFGKEIELEPGLAPGWSNRSYARVLAGDQQGAIQDATKAIELDPSLMIAWANRAEARFRSGDDAGAIGDATKALSMSPERAPLWKVRGLARKHLHDPEAARDLERFLELAPDDADAPRAREALAELRGKER